MFPVPLFQFCGNSRCMKEPEVKCNKKRVDCCQQSRPIGPIRSQMTEYVLYCVRLKNEFSLYTLGDTYLKIEGNERDLTLI